MGCSVTPSKFRNRDKIQGFNLSTVMVKQPAAFMVYSTITNVIVVKKQSVYGIDIGYTPNS